LLLKGLTPFTPREDEPFEEVRYKIFATLSNFLKKILYFRKMRLNQLLVFERGKNLLLNSILTLTLGQTNHQKLHWKVGIYADGKLEFMQMKN